MQLLGTSTEVSFDRSYPCENRCLASILHYLEPLAGLVSTPDGYWMDDPGKLWWVDPASFNFAVAGTPLDYPQVGVDRMALHRGAVTGLWRAYTEASPWPGDRPPRFYAEKYAGYADVLAEAGIPYRWIDLVRDPRDVWCSVMAFDRKRGFYGFGRREDETEEQYLESFLRAVRRRLDAMAFPTDSAPAITVRYEDLVGHLPREAARLGSWLGVQLDADAALSTSGDLGHHKTAASAHESIGRWRQDVAHDVIAHIEDVLGDHLARYGYQRDVDTEDLGATSA